MGMFDDINCGYPLPGKVRPGSFQTKDTPAQYLDLYEIREDGTLWHEDYDIEDKSDPDAEGFAKFVGCMTRVNKRWEQCKNFTGEISFYGFADEKLKTGWVEFSSYFLNGEIQQINIIENVTK